MARAAGFVQGHQARHADQEREAPVGSTRAKEPDQARLERLDESTDQLDVRVIERWPTADRARDAVHPEGPGVAQRFQREQRDEQVVIAARETVRRERWPLGGEIAWTVRGPFGRELDQLPEDGLHRLVDESRPVDLQHASAQGHQRGRRGRVLVTRRDVALRRGPDLRRPCGREEKADPLQTNRLLRGARLPVSEQRVQKTVVSHDRRLSPQVLILDQVPSCELFAEQPIRVLADRDAMDDERAIVEDGVAMQETAEIVAAEPDRPGRAVLEVKNLVIEADRSVAAAGAPFVGVDVEIVHGGPRRRPRRRRREEARDDDEGGAEADRASRLPSRRRSRPSWPWPSWDPRRSGSSYTSRAPPGWPWPS